MTWSVYIVRCSDTSLYTGISNNVEARINAHNTGKGARYTRGRRPVELVYEEVAGNQGSATSREMQIKALSRSAKQQLITSTPRRFAD